MTDWKTEDAACEAGKTAALALGAFDGLHRGHMAVIGAAVQAGLRAEVVTFTESPGGDSALLTPGDKLSLLRQAGVQEVCSLRFDRVRDMSAEEFFSEILCGQCRAAALFCGEDYRFGRGARGDTALLAELCRREGIGLQVIPPVTENGEKISSTRIRALIRQGDIPGANLLLGRAFGYTLEVIHGNHIGTGLGTPTINQALPENFTLPPFGVYASLVEIDGTQYAGVTNIGVKPTVGSDRVLSETWMPAYSGDLYGRELRLSLYGFIRPERKFYSLEELKEEIGRNAKQAQQIVESLKNGEN